MQGVHRAGGVYQTPSAHSVPGMTSIPDIYSILPKYSKSMVYSGNIPNSSEVFWRLSATPMGTIIHRDDHLGPAPVGVTRTGGSDERGGDNAREEAQAGPAQGLGPGP